MKARISFVTLLLGIALGIAQAKNLRESINDFSISLYQGVISEHRTRLNNIVLAPILVQKALASLTLGALPSTQVAIEQAININKTRDDLANLFHELLASLVNNGDVQMTNVQFISTKYRPLPSYVTDASYYYYTTAVPIDFSNNKVAAKLIDNYVGKNTQGQLSGVILPGDLTRKTEMVLVNAISFTGTWKTPFDPWFTTQGDFFKPVLSEFFDSSSYSSSNVPWDSIQYSVKTEQANYMNQLNKFNYGLISNLQATAVQIPYKNPDYSLLILLPELTEGIFDLEQQINQYSVSAILSELSEQWVNITIPKFGLNLNTDVSQALQGMGLKKIFGNQADLNYVATPVHSGLPPLVVSDILTKSQIVFNEGETFEQAGYQSANPYPVNPTSTQTFQCNRPFFFHVLYKGTTLILGRILKS